ncbi:MAG: alpha/beta hydrolase [Pseudomonadales bacterium]|nr:alpha/beta hydrolase [Pseudomonadales bacterium]
MKNTNLSDENQEEIKMPSQEHEALVAAVQAAPPAAGTLEASRAGYDAMLGANPVAEDVTIEELTIGNFNADWVSTPNSHVNRCILYLHGGGYVIGSNIGYREFAGRLARATQARVLVINYRLAPENPFPAAVDDAVAAYRYILGQGIGASRIMIAGDSAGGGLAIATLVALRDAGDPMPACATCLSPWVDLEMTGDSAQPGAVDDPMVATQGVGDFAAQYAGEDLRNPLAAPLHANLAGLPPLLVFVGTREILFDDATRIVENAQSAGVEATLQIGQGLIHVWPVFPLPESAETLESIGAFTLKNVS